MRAMKREASSPRASASTLLYTPSGFGELKTYHPGEVIYRPADRAERLYRVQRGEVRLLRVTQGARTQLISLLSAGDLFGEASANGTETMGDQAESAGSSGIWSIRHDELRALLAADVQAGLSLLDGFAREVRKYRHRLDGFTRLEVRARLAQTLLSLAETRGNPCPHGGEVHLRQLTQEDLADLVGATRSFVSTLINEMKRDGVLASSGRVLCLLDRGALAKEAAAEQ